MPPTPMIAVRISVIVSILDRDDNSHGTWDNVVYHVKNGNWEIWINTLSSTLSDCIFNMGLLVD